VFNQITNNNADKDTMASLSHALGLKASEIQKCDPKKQPPVSHDLGMWKQYLDHTDFTQLLKSVGTFNSSDLSISRISLFEQIRKRTPLRTRFIAQMIWGYSKTTTNALKRVSELIKYEHLESSLNKCESELKKFHLKEAYNALNKIPNLGTSYISKVLYFEGWNQDWQDKPKPLIYDNRVARTLVTNAFTKGDRWLIDSVTICRADSFRGYQQYLCRMHKLSLKFKIEADHIEYWLFKYYSR
jgi:hypothetical protein